MLFSKFLLTSLVGAASAVSIPKGTEEGVYDHHVDANGNDVFVNLANATNYSGKEPSPYSPKPFAGRFKREETAHCSPGPELDHRVSPPRSPICPARDAKASPDTKRASGYRCSQLGPRLAVRPLRPDPTAPQLLRNPRRRGGLLLQLQLRPRAQVLVRESQA